MTARALGSSSPAALLNPVKPSRGYHLYLLTPVLVALGEPGLGDLLDTGPGPRPEAGPDHCGGVRGSGRS